ncbi:MAG: hypothetical protein LQ343_001033 [Gyalolechia ehrenbergii]|nr:MAG: hypothetical protein LQ343_001033 [Gyalolechia ehrenbergii]
MGLLRNSDDGNALKIIRMASKRSQCTVSWNHVIDYEMSKGRVQKAERVYNEMKKRAQQPDAQTYTILLRGLSWHPHPKETLPRALNIYHSMYAHNCPVQPNIIHTNAVLKVCALAKDMDALWGVTAKLPARGSGAADNLTFTILLNAIRTVAWHPDKDLPDEEPVEKSVRRQRAVMQGRRLWEEIVPRWRAGNFRIDERLVCAMGRLLLLGSTERDYDDILSLAEQVMAIPRQKQRLPSMEQPPDAVEPPPTSSASADPEESSTFSNAQVDETPVEGDENTWSPQEEDASFQTQSGPVPTLTPALANVFLHRPTSKRSPISTALPGRNTLSLILDACIRLHAIAPAQAYWGLLTDPSGPYNIQPDAENYHMYLRLLRVQRASKLAVALLRDIHSSDLKGMKILQPKTVRIAMSCCVRDKENTNALSHAQGVLEVMYKSLEQPDVKACKMYLVLVSASAKRDFRASISALRTLEPGMRMLKNWVNYQLRDVGDWDDESVFDLARKVVGACDLLRGVAGDRLDREEKKWLEHLKLGWSVWVQRRKQNGDAILEKRRSGRREEVVEHEEGDERGRELPIRSVRRGREVKGFARGQFPAARLEGGMRKRMERGKREMKKSGEFDFYNQE